MTRWTDKINVVLATPPDRACELTHVWLFTMWSLWLYVSERFIGMVGVSLAADAWQGWFALLAYGLWRGVRSDFLPLRFVTLMSTLGTWVAITAGGIISRHTRGVYPPMDIDIFVNALFIAWVALTVIRLPYARAR